MPYKCCVTGCRGNYTGKEKVSIFSFPRDEYLKEKWIKCIQRNDFFWTKNSRVCQHHFKPDDLLWEASGFDEKTGRLLTAPLRRPRIKTGVLPSIFPSYLSSEAGPCRPRKRQQRAMTKDPWTSTSYKKSSKKKNVSSSKETDSVDLASPSLSQEEDIAADIKQEQAAPALITPFKHSTTLFPADVFMLYSTAEGVDKLSKSVFSVYQESHHSFETGIAHCIKKETPMEVETHLHLTNTTESFFIENSITIESSTDSSYSFQQSNPQCYDFKNSSDLIPSANLVNSAEAGHDKLLGNASGSPHCLETASNVTPLIKEEPMEAETNLYATNVTGAFVIEDNIESSSDYCSTSNIKDFSSRNPTPLLIFIKNEKDSLPVSSFTSNFVNEISKGQNEELTKAAELVSPKCQSTDISVQPSPTDSCNKSNLLDDSSRKPNPSSVSIKTEKDSLTVSSFTCNSLNEISKSQNEELTKAAVPVSPKYQSPVITVVQPSDSGNKSNKKDGSLRNPTPLSVFIKTEKDSVPVSSFTGSSLNEISRSQNEELTKASVPVSAKYHSIVISVVQPSSTDSCNKLNMQDGSSKKPTPSSVFIKTEKDLLPVSSFTDNSLSEISKSQNEEVLLNKAVLEIQSTPPANSLKIKLEHVGDFCNSTNTSSRLTVGGPIKASLCSSLADYSCPQDEDNDDCIIIDDSPIKVKAEVIEITEEHSACTTPNSPTVGRPLGDSVSSAGKSPNGCSSPAKAGDEVLRNLKQVVQVLENNVIKTETDLNSNRCISPTSDNVFRTTVEAFSKLISPSSQWQSAVVAANTVAERPVKHNLNITEHLKKNMSPASSATYSSDLKIIGKGQKTSEVVNDEFSTPMLPYLNFNYKLNVAELSMVISHLDIMNIKAIEKSNSPSRKKMLLISEESTEAFTINRETVQLKYVEEEIFEPPSVFFQESRPTRDEHFVNRSINQKASPQLLQENTIQPFATENLNIEYPKEIDNSLMKSVQGGSLSISFSNQQVHDIQQDSCSLSPLLNSISQLYQNSYNIISSSQCSVDAMGISDIPIRSVQETSSAIDKLVCESSETYSRNSDGYNFPVPPSINDGRMHLPDLSTEVLRDIINKFSTLDNSNLQSNNAVVSVEEGPLRTATDPVHTPTLLPYNNKELCSTEHGINLYRDIKKFLSLDNTGLASNNASEDCSLKTATGDVHSVSNNLTEGENNLFRTEQVTKKLLLVEEMVTYDELATINSSHVVRKSDLCYENLTSIPHFEMKEPVIKIARIAQNIIPFQTIGPKKLNLEEYRMKKGGVISPRYPRSKTVQLTSRILQNNLRPENAYDNYSSNSSVQISPHTEFSQSPTYHFQHSPRASGHSTSSYKVAPNYTPHKVNIPPVEPPSAFSPRFLVSPVEGKLIETPLTTPGVRLQEVKYPEPFNTRTSFTTLQKIPPVFSEGPHRTPMLENQLESQSFHPLADNSRLRNLQPSKERFNPTVQDRTTARLRLNEKTSILSEAINQVPSKILPFVHGKTAKSVDPTKPHSNAAVVNNPELIKKMFYSLLPNWIKSDVGRNFISTSNVYLIIIEWSVDWMLDIEKKGTHPPITSQFLQVKNTYKDALEYYNTYFPLMLLEYWHKICSALRAVKNKDVSAKQGHRCRLASCTEMNNYINVVCDIVLPNKKVSSLPQEGYVALVRFGTHPTGSMKMLGYVHSSKNRPFDHSYDQLHETIKYCKNTDRATLVKVKLSFYIAFSSDGIDPKQLIQVSRLTSIKKMLKQNVALNNILLSHLHGVLLNPLQYKVLVLSLPSTEASGGVMQTVTEAIQLPTPQITLLRTTEASDPVFAVAQLADHLKTKKLLICCKSEATLAKLGLCLLNTQPDALAIINREREVIPLSLQRHTLDHLVVEGLKSAESRTDSLRLVLEQISFLLSLVSNCHYEDIQSFIGDVTCCIVLEANLCTEPESVLPLLYNIKKLVLVGDPAVPCKVLSEIANSYEYNKSLFHRMFSIS